MGQRVPQRGAAGNGAGTADHSLQEGKKGSRCGTSFLSWAPTLQTHGVPPQAEPSVLVRVKAEGWEQKGPDRQLMSR